jgi:hypothetical protein
MALMAAHRPPTVASRQNMEKPIKINYMICDPDIIRWQVECAERKQANFNRALLVSAAMLKNAGALG